MAKQCAICGTEKMNLFQSIKLQDGNYICRKTCKKCGLRDLNYGQSSLEKVLAHIKQVEQGAKLWEQFFAPRLKSKKLEIFMPVYVSEDTGLMALQEKRSFFFFWNKSEHYCVYRIADLCAYRLEIEQTSSNNKGSSQTNYYIRFLFDDAVEGLIMFRKRYSKKTSNRLIEYFDSLFGVVTPRQNFIDVMTQAWSSMMDLKSEETGFSLASKEEQQISMIKKMGNYKSGDRTKWLERADATLKEINN